MGVTLSASESHQKRAHPINGAFLDDCVIYALAGEHVVVRIGIDQRHEMACRQIRVINAQMAVHCKASQTRSYSRDSLCRAFRIADTGCKRQVGLVGLHDLA